MMFGILSPALLTFCVLVVPGQTAEPVEGEPTEIIIPMEVQQEHDEAKVEVLLVSVDPS
jgi:hypothetical protein